METRITLIEAIIPTLATREDLIRAETRLEAKVDSAVNRLELQIKQVEINVHKNIHDMAWQMIKWMTGTLVTLIPTMFAGAFYIARYVH